MEENATAFELQPAELPVPLKAAHAGRTYRLVHRLRPPNQDDWVAYEAALRLSVEELPGEEDDSETRYRFDARNAEAAQALWDRLALGVDGYASTSEDWKSRIPLAHKEAAIRSLTLVAPARLDEAGTAELLPLAAERIPVVLEAARAGLAFPRLVHWFRPPALDDERRYRRLMAETLMVGGSRGSRALIPPRLSALCRFYDSLILATENYRLNGSRQVPLGELARRMDAWHKRAAVQLLFGDASDIEPAGEPVEVSS